MFRSLALTASLFVLAATTAPASAQDRYALTNAVSGEVHATTDYRARGISRSDEGLSAGGHVQFNHPSGLYGGIGADTVDLAADNDADIEGVLFGGLRGNFDGMDYNARLSYTGYPGADNDDLDYWEFTATGGYDFDVFYAWLTWAFSPNYINDSGTALYYAADIAVPLPTVYDLTLKGHVGFQFIDDERKYAEDYADWSLGLWYNWAQYDVDFGLTYVDTDLDDKECVEKCGARGVLSVSKKFGW